MDPDKLDFTFNTTVDALNAVGAVLTTAGNLASGVAPFLPFVKDIADIFNNLINTYKKAQHHKKICGLLVKRVNTAQAAINDIAIRQLEYREKLADKAFKTKLNELRSVIREISEFAAYVSQLRKFNQFLHANSVESQFDDLTKHFDQIMVDLNFVIAAQVLAQQREDAMIAQKDAKETKEFLEEMRGEIVDNNGVLLQVLQQFKEFRTALENNIVDPNDYMKSIRIDKASIDESPEPEEPRGDDKSIEKKFYGKHVNVALKRVAIEDEKSRKKYERELGIFTKLKQSENIVKFYGILESDGALQLVLEWADYGDLAEFIDKQKDLLTWQLKASIAVDICRGLLYLQSVDIYHHDVRSKNVVVNDRCVAKLTNFGHARKSTESTTNMIQELATTRYMAPEKVKDRNAPYTKECEIYSFGMLLWEIAEERIPFPVTEGEETFSAIRNAIINDRKNLKFTKGASSEWHGLVYESTRYLPEMRPLLMDIFLRLNALYKKVKTLPDIPQGQSLPNFNSDSNVDMDDDLFGDEEEITMSLQEAVNQLEKLKSKGDDTAQAESLLKVFEKYKDEGNREGIYYYADIIYRNLNKSGEDEKTLKTRAAELFKRAADLGNVEAQYRYGFALYKGEGDIKKDQRESVKYFQMAADGGHHVARYNMGIFYLDAKAGVKADERKGKSYLRSSALQGYSKAITECKKRNIDMLDIAA